MTEINRIEFKLKIATPNFSYWKDINQDSSAYTLSLKNLESRISKYVHQDNFFVFTTMNGESTIRKEIIRLIEETNEKIFCSTWLMNDWSIYEQIKNKAKELKGGIYLLTPIESKWDYEYYNMEGIAVMSKHTEILNDLKKEDNLINARGYPHAHLKLWIFDDKVAVLSSANLRTTSLGTNFDKPLHQNNEYIPGQTAGNPEAGVVIRDTNQVKVLSNFFKFLWTNANPIEHPELNLTETDFPSFSKNQLIQSFSNGLSVIIDIKKPENKNIKKINSIDLISENLASKIYNHNDYNMIKVSGYSFKLDNSQLNQFLKCLRKNLQQKKQESKKIKVQILINRLSKYKNMREIIKNIKQFFDGHTLEIRKHTQNHSKCILFMNDSKTIFGAVSTGEFFPAKFSGINVAYITEKNSILDSINAFFNHTWLEANKELILDSNLSEENELEDIFEDTIYIRIFDIECMVERSKYTIPLSFINKILKKRFFQCWEETESIFILTDNKKELFLKIQKISNEFFTLEEVVYNKITQQREELKKLRQQVENLKQIKPPNKIVFVVE